MVPVVLAAVLPVMSRMEPDGPAFRETCVFVWLCWMVTAAHTAPLMPVYLFVSGCPRTQAPLHGFTLSRIWGKKLRSFHVSRGQVR